MGYEILSQDDLGRLAVAVLFCILVLSFMTACDKLKDWIKRKREEREQETLA